jgi:hypothetical protein
MTRNSQNDQSIGTITIDCSERSPVYTAQRALPCDELYLSQRRKVFDLALSLRRSSFSDFSQIFIFHLVNINIRHFYFDTFH